MYFLEETETAASGLYVAQRLYMNRTWGGLAKAFIKRKITPFVPLIFSHHQGHKLQFVRRCKTPRPDFLMEFQGVFKLAFYYRTRKSLSGFSKRKKSLHCEILKIPAVCFLLSLRFPTLF